MCCVSSICVTGASENHLSLRCATPSKMAGEWKWIRSYKDLLKVPKVSPSIDPCIMRPEILDSNHVQKHMFRRWNTNISQSQFRGKKNHPFCCHISDGTSIVNANPHQDERQDLVQNRKGHAQQHGSAVARHASEDHQEELGDACETAAAWNTAMPHGDQCSWYKVPPVIISYDIVAYSS